MTTTADSRVEHPRTASAGKFHEYPVNEMRQAVLAYMEERELEIRAERALVAVTLSTATLVLCLTSLLP